jgi:hypothetical protein
VTCSPCKEDHDVTTDESDIEFEVQTPEEKLKLMERKLLYSSDEVN